jgi:hypothetical protein
MNKIKINWDRIDKSKYQELVEVSLANQDVSDNIDNLKSKRDVEEKLTKVSEILKTQLWNASLEKRERKNLANYKSGIKTYLMHIKK